MTNPDPTSFFASAVVPHFDRIFKDIPQPDPLADHEAVEGIAVMVEQDE